MQGRQPPTKDLVNSLGQKVTVFQNDFIGAKIEKEGLYERDNLEVLLALLARMDRPVVFDVGANIGNHTLAFATKADRVHAFEPLPGVFSLLEANIRNNDLAHVTAHNYALSDENSAAEMFAVTSGNVGASSFDARPPTEATSRIAVQKRIGDEVVRELALDRIDLVKMDVEGHETYALGGLMRSVRRFLPFIALEWNDPLTVQRMRESGILPTLTEDYFITVMADSHQRVWWEHRRFPWLGRKWARLSAKAHVLAPFDAGRLYKNLLLIPKQKLALVPPIPGLPAG